MEFAPIEITNAGADVLVLSGDIVVADYFKRSEQSPYYQDAQDWLNWFERTCARFPRVIYVLGNHEHYSGRFDDTFVTLKNNLRWIPNLTILDNTSIDLDGVHFFGTTLWTDFNRDMMGAKLAVQSGLNDYHFIKRNQGGSYRKLRPNDTLFYNYEAVRLIDEAAAKHDRMVVVGHHAPSMRSIAERFRGAGLINYGYASDLDRYIDAHPSIKLWTHGHVHLARLHDR